MISIAYGTGGAQFQTCAPIEQKRWSGSRRGEPVATRMYSQADIDRPNLINELTSEASTRWRHVYPDLGGAGADEREEEVEDSTRGCAAHDRVRELENRTITGAIVRVTPTRRPLISSPRDAGVPSALKQHQRRFLRGAPDFPCCTCNELGARKGTPPHPRAYSGRLSEATGHRPISAEFWQMVSRRGK